MSPSTANRKRTPGTRVPVRVVSGKQAAPAPSAPPAPEATKPANTKPAPTPSGSPRKPVQQLPVEHRKRLMWGIVAGLMLFVVFGWAMSLGHVLRQDGKQPSLVTQLTDLFKTFQLPSAKAEPRSPEIKQLDQQVFPQFQQ